MTFPSTHLYPGRAVPTGSSRDLTLKVALVGNRFTARLGDDVPRQIRVSQGAVEYVHVTVTETTGADITGSTFEVSLGGYTAPGTWMTPDAVTNPSTDTADVALLVGTGVLPAPGRYWVWVQVVDTPEIVPVRCDQPVTIN